MMIVKMVRQYLSKPFILGWGTLKSDGECTKPPLRVKPGKPRLTAQLLGQ